MEVRLTYQELERRVRSLEKELAKRDRNKDAVSRAPANLTSIIENSTNLFYSHTADHRLTYLSPQITSLLGYTPEEAMGRWTDLVSDNPINAQGMQWTVRAIETGKPQPPYELELVHKNGRNIWVEVREVPVTEQGQTVAIVGALTDITDRKRAETTLRESEAQKQAILDASVDIILHMDKEMNIIWANREAWESIGLEGPGKLIGRKCHEVYLNSGEPCPGCACKRCMATGRIEHSTYFKKGVTAIGDSWWENIGIPLKEPSGKVIGAIEMDRNITARKLAEMEKIKAQAVVSEQKKLALVGQVAGKLAHDFNNILGIIMGNSELAIMDCTDDTVRKTLELIFDQTLRGRNLTRNLVAFAKDQELKEAFFSVRGKISLVLNLLKKDLEGITLIRKDDPDVPELLADPGMIEHALVNIVQNAIHATSLVRDPQITIRTRSTGESICLEIEDNGCGIEDQYLDSIFEPSFTLKGGKDTTGSYRPDIDGTGYGMANVKKYVEQHKGSISVRTRFGSGTVIAIHLPVIRKELTVHEQMEIRRSGSHSEKAILLVEDEQALSDVQYRILTGEPFRHTVDIASSGRAALKLLSARTYDLVSLDYFLPGVYTGMDVYTHIRESDPSTPVLFISGNIEFLESIKELKLKDPAIDHLSKPCRNMDYVNSINALLDRTL